MAQFSVYANLNPATKDRYPLLLDIQNRLFDSLDTRLVIPMTPLSRYEAKPIKELMPIIAVHAKKYVLMTPLQAGVQKKVLGNEVADASSMRQEIVSAIDFLITGF